MSKYIEISIKKILYDKIKKDDRYVHAVLLPVKLSPKPDRKWQDLFVTTYHSRFYPSRIPHTKIHNDIIYVTSFINDNQKRIQTYLNILKLAIADTNRAYNQIMQQNKKKMVSNGNNESDAINKLKNILRKISI